MFCELELVFYELFCELEFYELFCRSWSYVSRSWCSVGVGVLRAVQLELVFCELELVFYELFCMSWCSMSCSVGAGVL